MPEMILSAEEIHLIEEDRAKREEIKKKKSERLEILKTAYEYEKWLQEHGAGSTFSTFCDDFGYSGKNRKFMFNAVTQIRLHANDEAG